jgi:hypothetical protein
MIWHDRCSYSKGRFRNEILHFPLLPRPIMAATSRSKSEFSDSLYLLHINLAWELFLYPSQTIPNQWRPLAIHAVCSRNGYTLSHVFQMQIPNVWRWVPCYFKDFTISRSMLGNYFRRFSYLLSHVGESCDRLFTSVLLDNTAMSTAWSNIKRLHLSYGPIS